MTVFQSIFIGHFRFHFSFGIYPLSSFLSLSLSLSLYLSLSFKMSSFLSSISNEEDQYLKSNHPVEDWEKQLIPVLANHEPSSFFRNRYKQFLLENRRFLLKNASSATYNSVLRHFDKLEKEGAQSSSVQSIPQNEQRLVETNSCTYDYLGCDYEYEYLGELELHLSDTHLHFLLALQRLSKQKDHIRFLGTRLQAMKELLIEYGIDFAPVEERIKKQENKQQQQQKQYQTEQKTNNNEDKQPGEIATTATKTTKIIINQNKKEPKLKKYNKQPQKEIKEEVFMMVPTIKPQQQQQEEEKKEKDELELFFNISFPPSKMQKVNLSYFADLEQCLRSMTVDLNLNQFISFYPPIKTWNKVILFKFSARMDLKRAKKLNQEEYNKLKIGECDSIEELKQSKELIAIMVDVKPEDIKISGNFLIKDENGFDSVDATGSSSSFHSFPLLSPPILSSLSSGLSTSSDSSSFPVFSDDIYSYNPYNSYTNVSGNEKEKKIADEEGDDKVNLSNSSNYIRQQIIANEIDPSEVEGDFLVERETTKQAISSISASSCLSENSPVFAVTVPSGTRYEVKNIVAFDCADGVRRPMKITNIEDDGKWMTLNAMGKKKEWNERVVSYSNRIVNVTIKKQSPSSNEETDEDEKTKIKKKKKKGGDESFSFLSSPIATSKPIPTSTAINSIEKNISMTFVPMKNHSMGFEKLPGYRCVSINPTLCPDFNTRGGCEKNDCKLKHVEGLNYRAIVRSSDLGAGRNPCNEWVLKGMCKKSNLCTFRHESPIG